MLQYDLTNTPLFEACTSAQLPTEAETFVITVGLLLIHDAALSALHDSDLTFNANDLENLVACIEGPLSALACDLGHGQQLRDRLADFVGLRISHMTHRDLGASRSPR